MQLYNLVIWHSRKKLWVVYEGITTEVKDMLVTRCERQKLIYQFEKAE